MKKYLLTTLLLLATGCAEFADDVVFESEVKCDVLVKLSDSSSHYDHYQVFIKRVPPEKVQAFGLAKNNPTSINYFTPMIFPVHPSHNFVSSISYDIVDNKCNIKEYWKAMHGYLALHRLEIHLRTDKDISFREGK